MPDLEMLIGVDNEQSGRELSNVRGLAGVMVDAGTSPVQ